MGGAGPQPQVGEDFLDDIGLVNNFRWTQVEATAVDSLVRQLSLEELQALQTFVRLPAGRSAYQKVHASLLQDVIPVINEEVRRLNQLKGPRSP